MMWKRVVLLVCLLLLGTAAFAPWPEAAQLDGLAEEGGYRR
jgi:hypothetical protein